MLTMHNVCKLAFLSVQHSNIQIQITTRPHISKAMLILLLYPAVFIHRFNIVSNSQNKLKDDNVCAGLDRKTRRRRVREGNPA